jgi:uracil DNA glycosylase
MLWESYQDLMNRSWFEFLFPILQSEKFHRALRFVSRRRKSKEYVYPHDAYLFHPFKFSSPEDCVAVILGDHGPYDYVINDNLSIPLHVGSSLPEKSMQFIAELRRTREHLERVAQHKYQNMHTRVIPIDLINSSLKGKVGSEKSDKITSLLKAHKEGKEKTILELFEEIEDEFPMESIAKQDVLMLNVAFTSEDSERRHQHRAAWLPIVQEILTKLSNTYENKYYTTFEPANLAISDFVNKQKNAFSYHNSVLGSDVFKKINRYILKKYNDPKKIIDWSIVLHLLQKVS